MVVYNSIDDINLQQWNELIRVSSTASFFQTEECYRFFDSLSFLKPFVLGVSENNVLTGVVCGYIIADGNPIKRFLSRRAIICSGPALHPDVSEDALLALLTATRTHLQFKSIYTEFRNYTDYAGYKAVFERAGFCYLPHMNFHVLTPSVDGALKQLNTTKRRDVRVTKKNGTDWFESKSQDDLVEFYKELELLYKTKVKTPLFPFEFFERLIQLPHGHFFVVKHEGRVIGGSICVELEDRILYEWFVCGLDGLIKNVYSSTVATWAGIEFAAERGFSHFDMMGAGKPNEDYGVREFKSKFGGELLELGRFQAINQKLLYKTGKMGVDFYKNVGRKNTEKRKLKIDNLTYYKLYAEIKSEEWVDLLSNSSGSSFFQTPECFDFYLKNSFLEPFVYGVSEGGKLMGLVCGYIVSEGNPLRKFLSRRAIVPGGVLIHQQAKPEIVEQLLELTKKELSSKAIYLEIRNYTDFELYKPTFKDCDFDYLPHLNFHLATTNADEVSKKLSSSKRRQIKQSLSNGAACKVADSEQELLEFYDILKELYSQKIKLPLFSIDFFREFLHSEIGKILVVKYNDKVVGGILCVFYTKKVLYEWFVCGLDNVDNNVYPSVLATWGGIEYAMNNGFEYFDFMGAGKPNEGYGVREFKSKFGGELVEHGRFLHIINKPLYSLGKAGVRYLKKRK